MLARLDARLVRFAPPPVPVVPVVTPERPRCTLSFPVEYRFERRLFALLWDCERRFAFFGGGGGCERNAGGDARNEGSVPGSLSGGVGPTATVETDDAGLEEALNAGGSMIGGSGYIGGNEGRLPRTPGFAATSAFAVDFEFKVEFAFTSPFGSAGTGAVVAGLVTFC